MAQARFARARAAAVMGDLLARELYGAVRVRGPADESRAGRHGTQSVMGSSTASPLADVADSGHSNDFG